MGVYYKIRKDGSRAWYYDLCIDGKRMRGIGGRSKREAVEALANLREKHRIGEDVFKKPDDPKLDEFVAEFLNWSKNNKRSYKRDEQLANNLLRWFGYRKLSSIECSDIERYKVERKQENRNGRFGSLDRKITNATVNRELACLKRMYNLAIQWGKARKNPVNGVRFLHEPPKKERYVTAEEARKLLQRCLPFNSTSAHLCL